MQLTFPTISILVQQLALRKKKSLKINGIVFGCYTHISGVVLCHPSLPERKSSHK